MSKTNWKKLGDPRFLGEYSFDDGKDKILTIKEIRNEEVFEVNSKQKQVKRTAIFKETKLMMVLNTTNCEILQKLFKSEYIEDWYNKPIAVYFDPTVKVGREQVGGLRIRKSLPVGNKPTYICEMCGRTIADTDKFTAEAICKSTTLKFGKCLCMDCGTKAKEEAEKPTLEDKIGALMTEEENKDEENNI